MIVPVSELTIKYSFQCRAPLQVSHMFRCARIQGLDTTEALLLFGREHFYIVDGFTLLKTREIRDIESLPPGEKLFNPLPDK